MSLIQVRNEDIPGVIAEPAITFPYTPDAFQQHAFYALEQNQHILVTAHTGSGKTSIGEYAIGKAVRDGKKVVYTTPIKALSNQIYSDIHRKYPTWDIGIKTGDIDLKSEAQVVIMTTEILRNRLFKGQVELAEIGMVIFDEVHYIKDRERGTVWEESIIMMPAHIQMVLLSATLPDAVAFGTWVATCKGRTLSYITTEKRVVPLTHYLMTGANRAELVQILDNGNVFDGKSYIAAAGKYNFKPSMLNAYVRAMDLPAMFFCFSRKKCETHAGSIQVALVDGTEATAIGNLYASLIRKFDKALATTKQAIALYPLLLKGVGYHHAGLLAGLKEIVQVLFTEGLIKVLFVTETFAAGVNMPAKTVVFTGLTKFNTTENNFRLLYTEEYRQMAGRAGRRGIDDKGVVILLPFRADDLPDGPVMRGLLTGKVNPIVSRFKMDFSYVLKSILNGRPLLDAIGQSLYTTQLKEEMVRCQLRLDGFKASRPSGEIPPAALEIVQTHCHFKGRMLSGKAVKAYHKAVAEFPGGLPALEKLYAIYEAETSRKKAIADEEYALASMTCEIASELNHKLGFLYRHNFLAAVYPDFNQYTPADLTPLGRACTEINECDPHILAKCICSGAFDGLTDEELMAGLAVFLGEEKSREVKYSDLGHKLNPIYTIEREVNEQRRAARLEDCPALSDYWVNPVLAWVTEGKIGTVYNEEGQVEELSEGEFVKAVLKVANICEETLAVANLLQQDELAKKLEHYKERLIWGLVTPQSLYV
jgi:superfamily II RNA helicase